MRTAAQLGFAVESAEVRNDILVPRYYDPTIDAELADLQKTHELLSVQELIDRGQLTLSQGRYVPKMHYGTGPIPYVRTSDLANWELRASPKHGVSEAVWAEHADQQDVRPGDVLLVHEGTYLIGTCAPVTTSDLPLLFQHHLAKLRVSDDALLTGPLLAALLGAPVVQRQIRARQFTADVIDSIVGRLQEVILPIPRDAAYRDELANEASAIFEERAEARSRLSLLVRGIDEALASGNSEVIAAVTATEVPAGEPMALLGDRIGFRAFTHSTDEIANDVLVPAYYDPTIDEVLDDMQAAGCELATIGDLAGRGVLSLETGDEVGKLAYGTGNIPFVRTSDLATWELKTDPKQRVSQAVFDAHAEKQSAYPGDLLVVRDGTYLVGTASIIAESDVPMLFSGGIYRVRVENTDVVNPYLLLVLLWSDIVRRQVRAKRFTRDIIDTLGRRFEEIILPIPPAPLRVQITEAAQELVERRIQLRDAATGFGARLQTLDVRGLSLT